MLSRLGRTRVNPRAGRGLSDGRGQEASALVVGGGAVGCSIAYHLAKSGLKNVVLLESKKIGSSAPRYPPGFVSSANPVPSFRHVLSYSMELYSQLRQEDGQKLPFHRPGTIRLAGTQERLEEFTRYLSKDWLGAESHSSRLLSPDQLRELSPLINVNKVFAALYTEGDGFLDPTSLIKALASSAQSCGARIIEDAPLLGLSQLADGTWEVHTNQGSIRALHLINASGLGAKASAAKLGLDLPLVNILHNYLVTEETAELSPDAHDHVPAVIDHENGWYLRPYGQSFLFGAFEPPEEVVLADTNPDGEWKIQKEQVKGLDAGYALASNVVPSLSKTGVARREAAVHSLTPDGVPLIGPVQGLSNYWLACGSFDGVATAGGVGKYISDWIREGEPSFDLIETCANRFTGWTDQKFLRTRAKESYSMTLNWFLSPTQRQGGRPSSRVSGIYGALVKKDAHMEYRGGWEVPGWFMKEGESKLSAMEAEYRGVREGCGVVDLSHKGLIEVRGTDGTEFLNYFLSAEAPQKVPDKFSIQLASFLAFTYGKMGKALALTPKGRIYSQIETIHHDHHHLLVCEPENEARNLRWMELCVEDRRFNVELLVVSSYLAGLGIVGPSSAKVLSELTKSSLSMEDFPVGSTRVLRLAGVPAILVRHSDTGEHGFEAFHSRADSLKLYEAIMGAGQRYGIADFGTEIFNTLRMEKGLPSDGTELSLNLNPLQAHVEGLVHMNKPDFVGKAALKDMSEKTQEWTIALCQLESGQGDRVAKGGELVRVHGSDEICGEVTSGFYSFHTKAPICFAKLKNAVLAGQTPTLSVDLGSERRNAQILKEPPVTVCAS